MQDLIDVPKWSLLAVGAHPRYSHLRKLFYDQINGVLLVHDLSVTNSRTSLVKWASEIATESTFVAPLPEDVATSNIGGLPVPVLVVGNKSDLLQYGGGVSIGKCRSVPDIAVLNSQFAPSPMECDDVSRLE